MLTSTRPEAGAQSWTKTRIAGAASFAAISCPSVSLCAAVDRAGDVAASSDPSNADVPWTVSHVRDGLTGISCPSASLCVTASATDVLVSTDPGASSPSWTVDPNADSDVGPECGKYGGDSGCAVAITLLTCPSVNLCVAVDNAGGEVSGSPQFSGSWGTGNAAGTEVTALACSPELSCFTACAVGEGFGGPECPGTEYGAGDVCTESAECFTVSRDALSGIWCQSDSLCFASDDLGDLFVSTHPVDGASAWAVARAATNRTSYAALAGVSCVARSACLALDATGELLLGTPPLSTRQIASLLLKQLVPRSTRTSIAALVRRGYYSYSVHLPARGRLRLVWAIENRRSTRSRAAIATASADLRNTAATKVRVLLTTVGRRLLASGRSLDVVVAGTLISSGNPTVRASRSFSVAR